jgi:UDP-glucose 4-epimerase
MKSSAALDENNNGIGIIGFSEPVSVDYSLHKKILITGAHSYIGESFEKYAHEHYAENFEIDTIDLIDGSWRQADFSSYDAVFHVAGIAHADVGNVSEETKKKYYAVNTDLAIETAQKAKDDGVKQFVFMSSMIVYGESAGYGLRRMITRDTLPAPANFYGDSKWQADKGVRALASENFNVTVLRPPMIYGKGSKGNYPTLAKMAKKLPVFPKVDNERSMLHIDNLCEFLCQIMLLGKGGIFIPQNGEYTNTCEMVKAIAEVTGKKIRESAIFTPAVFLGSKMPGKIGGLVNKAFGNMTYDKAISEYPGLDYQIVNLKESIIRTEGKSCSNAK